MFGFTDRFCELHLDHGYADRCRELIARLARKRPSPLMSGDLLNWAAGAIYTVAAANFLFDPNETPHLSVARLSELTGVPKSTLNYKSREICRALRIDRHDHSLCRAELLARHPTAWLVEMNGLIVDARDLPVEIQQEARRCGFIPDIAPPARTLTRTQSE